MKNGVLLLHSGGLDSFVSSAILVGLGKSVKALFFDYGQITASAEWVSAVDCVKEIQEAYGSGAITLHRELLTDYRRHVESYALVSGGAPDSSADGRLTFVPGRNILFLLMAAIIGYGDGYREIAFSSHSSDRVAGDCRPEFVESLQQTFRWGFGTKGEQELYKIWSPLQKMTKGQVVLQGVQRHLHLEKSWSCYRTGKVHCGVCHNCKDRRDAFIEAGVTDPTSYNE